MEIKELHEKVLYPVVRVKAPRAGGSGTVIYSKPNPENSEEYESFILTCAHVIDSAISTKKDWDSLLKKKIEKEYLEQISVEVFDYVYISKVNSSNSYRADIIAYDKYHDIAILKLDSPKKVEFISNLVARDKIASIKCFAPTWTSGCSLLHDPFANPGNITSLVEVFDNKLYWMGNGHSIFGNSGGAVFLSDTGEQVGITAMITSIPADSFGFAKDFMTWMGFFVAPQRIYEFIDEQELKFLYDSRDTYKKAIERRKIKQEAIRTRMLTQEGKDEEDEEKE